MSALKLSIIIPCLNEAENIVETLSYLQCLRQRGHEVILSDGGSFDDSVKLSQPLVDHCINAAAGRATQMNSGAKIASGDILCFLHADTHAPKIIDQLILNVIQNTASINQMSWGFFNIKLNGTRWPFRIIEWFINQRSGISHIATGDQGIFIHKKLFHKISGFSEIPLMEDIEISKRLKKISRPICIKNNKLLTSSRRWEKHGIIHTVLLMWKLRLAYFLGFNANTLAKAYRSHEKNRQLIVFIKHPIAGKCKTRLIPFLSAEQASEFYKFLVEICFENIRSLTATDIAIYAYPDSNHPFIQSINSTNTITLHNQEGSNLGERMQHAISTSLKNYRQCVLIGTDCPLINTAYINDAFKSLQQHDMVFGPAEDGGYVLVGATKINENIFSNINWSTHHVLQQNLNNTKTAQFNTHLLKTLWDIDTPEDYLKYQSFINQTANAQE